MEIEGDPVREITQYWDIDGNFLAEKDDDPTLLAEQIEWESNRLSNIIKNWSQNRQPLHK